MSTTGSQKPPRRRIELIAGGASRSEAAAVVAAVEQFIADTAPAGANAAPPSRWQRAALEEGIAARQVSGSAWGHATS